MNTELTPETILYAYSQGIFPMANSADDEVANFYRPKMRGLLPIQNLHIPKRLLKIIKKSDYKITINQSFEKIIDGCAKTTKDRQNTWINKEIRKVFIELNKLGHAHSIECWYTKNNEQILAGGLYGLAIGQVFCGESMVSFQTNGSKISLIHLCARLSKGNFKILDTQFINDHLKQFGAYEIHQEDYEEQIKTLMKKPANFLLKNVKERDILKTYFLKK